MRDNNESISVPTADGPMTTFVWRPDGDGPFPVVVCYHHGPGLGEYIYSVARRFAQEGYLAAVPDLYHRRGECLTFDIPKALAEGEDGPERQRLMGTVMATTVEMMVSDTMSLLDAVRELPAASNGPAGLIGFCHTVRPVLAAMAQHPEVFPVGAIMHPSFAVTDAPDSPHLFVKDIKGQIYAGFGGADDLAPLSEQQPLIEELLRLGDRAVVEVHPRAGHGFMHEGIPSYDRDAELSAWHHTLAIFGNGLMAPTAG